MVDEAVPERGSAGLLINVACKRTGLPNVSVIVKSVSAFAPLGVCNST